MNMITGTVVEGTHVGGTLGIHTANLKLDADISWPPFGVYASWAVLKGERYKSATHVGPREMFRISEPSFEVHIFDFNENIYGSTLEVELVKKLRDVQSFPTVAELYTQILKDIEDARKVLVS